MGPFARVAWLVMRKDLTVEFRSREILSTTLFFALSAVLVFAVALVREGRTVVDAAAGILWVAIAFAGTLALGRTFERERYTDTLQALLLAPADRPAIYVGKLLGIVLMIGAAKLSSFRSSRSCSRRHSSNSRRGSSGSLLLGTIGFAAVGTLFAAMLVRARSRDVLLPVLLYPITIPVIIAGVRARPHCSADPADLAMAGFWTSLLAFFDAVFLVLALWTFEPLMTES